MTAQALIDLLADYPPQSEVTISLDEPDGPIKSVYEVPVLRVECVDGKPFIVGEI